MKKNWLAIVTITLMFATGLAHAGDKEAGREISLLCVSCHGAEGVSEHLNWPNFAGQNEGYIAKQLRDYRTGRRRNTWMSTMALGLSDSDIEDLAAYFSSLPPEKIRAGVRITNSKQQTCIACHGRNGVIEHYVWPNLAGQKKLYLIDQMNRFRSDERVDPLMTPIAKTLSDRDIEELAEYYSSSSE